MAVRVCLYTCVHVFLALRLSVTTGNPEKKQFSVVIEAWPHIGSHTHAYTYMKAHEFPAVMGVFCIQAWPHTGSVIYVHIHGSSCPLGFRHRGPVEPSSPKPQAYLPTPEAAAVPTFPC